MNVLDAIGADDRAFIAGSAAIAPAHADDIDVFVLPGSKVAKKEFDSFIWEPLNLSHSTYSGGLFSGEALWAAKECAAGGCDTCKEAVKGHYEILANSTGEGEVMADEAFGVSYIEKILQSSIAGNDYWAPMIIQLVFLSTGNKTGFDVLRNFDLSCHAWALTKDGFRIMHPKATLPGEPIRVLRETSKTPERLATFTKRYEHLKETGELTLWMPGC